jgi:acetyltransferase-like isoleucine patch superfamily enzyme
VVKVTGSLRAIINKIDRHITGKLYEKICIFWIPNFFGKLCFLFYKIIYQKNIQFGKNIQCWGRFYLWKSPESSIVIGDNVRIVSNYLRSGVAMYSQLKLTAFFKAIIIIGNSVAMVGTSITCRTTSIEIMDGTIIGPNVIIVDTDFHSLWPPDNRTGNMGYENDRPVKICKNVWIGMGCTILKGVTIGENSIIAAGSIVTKDIPPNVLAGGNPAKVIRCLT